MIKDLSEVIAEGVVVNHQMVTLAKSFILTNLQNERGFVSEVLELFLEQQSATLITPVTVLANDPVQTNEQASTVARHLSWQFAFVEALWSLLNSDVLLPYKKSTQATVVEVEHTYGSQEIKKWRFDQFHYVYPSIVRFAPSVIREERRPLSNADLFLSNLGIPDLHPGVAESLTLAVQCFRRDLFLPCIVMVGRASEGAWLELGRSLVKVPGVQESQSKSTATKLESDGNSITVKKKAVYDLFRSERIYDDLKIRTPFILEQLETVSIWSDHIKEIRNIVHYEKTESLAIDYESTAILLMSVAQHLKVLYNIRRTAELALSSNP